MRVGFPEEVRKYLVGMPRYSGLVWQHKGEPRIVIKLPGHIDFPLKRVTVGELKRDTSSTFRLTLHLQSGGDHSTSVICLINPPTFPDIQVLHALCSAQEMEVYAITPDLSYRGVQFIVWPEEKRKKLTLITSDLLTAKEVRKPVIKAQLASQKETFPLHKKHCQELHNLRSSKNEDGHLRERYDVSAGWVSVPTARVIHAFEEDVLKSVHLTTLTENQRRQFDEVTKNDEYNEHSGIYFPNYPFWVECPHSVFKYDRKAFGVFGFRSEYGQHPIVLRAGNQAYYGTYDSRCRWRLDFIDERGVPFLRLLSETFSEDVHWEIAPSHICPTHTCFISNQAPFARSLCTVCQREADFWLVRSNIFLAIIMNQPLKRGRTPTGPRPKPIPSSLMYEVVKSDKKQQSPPLKPPALSSPVDTRSSASSISAGTIPPPKPVIVTRALLIDRYTYQQKTKQKQEAVESAHKFLWMHSAWFMTEALRSTASENGLLRLPTNHIYIELEQPHDIKGDQFAACSFFRVTRDERTMQQWEYAIIDKEGRTIWSILYEYHHVDQHGAWTLPKEYVCPEQVCHVEDTEIGRLFTLCPACQERIAHYTSWVAVALRMIAGDFQEQVETCEPEEVLDISVKEVRDETTGEIQQKPILRRFKVIRYYDACGPHRGNPQTIRGSWMTGKPLAESEYEINPDAIIYVQIQPREHDRTYRHDRYTQMRGKTQHIDPKPRLQPMTIATFRQLPKLQRITKVYASQFE